MQRLLLPITMASLAALTACGKPADTPMAPPKPAATASEPVATAVWVGRWQGPEATFLEISGGPGSYTVTVQNLDGLRSFEAKAGTGTLVFRRDGALETIHPGTGPETGMKWLADKRDCLIVKAGEGYCRD